jgi:ATP-binding cassette subfamily B protein
VTRTWVIANEPTAALDAKAETKIFESLRGLVERTEGTAVLITHHLWNVRNVDRIIVLDKGKIVESGTHEELIAQGGRYYDLHELQARAYRD